MKPPEEPTSPQQRILEASNQIWNPRGIQASKLLSQRKQDELNAVPSMIPPYDEVARSVGTVRYNDPSQPGITRDGTSYGNEPNAQVSFDELLAERNALATNTLPALHALQGLLNELPRSKLTRYRWEL